MRCARETASLVLTARTAVWQSFLFQRAGRFGVCSASYLFFVHRVDLCTFRLGSIIMAGTYQGSTMGSARRLALAYLLILSAASLSSALPANKKPGVLDDIVYVSDDPAVKKWRQELSGAGIYPAHYALKALDLLPLPDTPSRLIKIRRRRRDREIGFTTEEPRASEGRARTPFRTRGLERRRRKKEKAGHDENGYDDGSWRGNNGDYGSEKYYSNSEYGQEENGYDDARHSSGSQKYEGSEASWYDRGQESDTVDYQSTDAQDGNDDASQSYFQPDKAKNKYKPYKSTDSNNFPEAGEADGWRAPGSSGGDGESERTTASDVRNDGSFTSMTPTAKTYDSEGRQNDDYGEDRDYTSSREASSSSDCATLKRFYEDMGGSGWIDNTGWTSSGDTRTSCCRAFGVSCNMDGHVTALDLGSNGLTGPLSTAVFELRYLSRL